MNDLERRVANLELQMAKKLEVDSSERKDFAQQLADHITRGPNRPVSATLVTGEIPGQGTFPNLPLVVEITYNKVQEATLITLRIGGRIYMQMPVDNLVKAACRIAPELASEPEREIAALRAELAAANGRLVVAEHQVAQLEAQRMTWSDTHKA